MQAVAGEQGSAGAGVPPGQYSPGWHCVALAALVLPAAQPDPGSALQLPEHSEVVRPGVLPKVPAGQRLQTAEPAAE